MTTKTIPVVYALTTCPACGALRDAWTEQGIEFEERLVDESQEWMDTARSYGDIVPIIVYPDGTVDNTGTFGGKYG
jgi:glutaredoxin